MSQKRLKTKTITVDGEKVVQAWVNGVWVEDVDINSQFSIKEAKEYLKEKYIN
jgi:hypothetical protein